MLRRLVPFDGTHFLEIDKVALTRTAQALSQLIPAADPQDSYGVNRLLRPLVARAIAKQIDTPILQRGEIMGGVYFFERQEGTLPADFNAEFNAALSRFLVRVMSLPLDPPETEIVGGQTMAWMELEEPDDWPDKVRHQ